MQVPQIISCDQFSDSRGKLFAFNQFDMSEIIRCYEIQPSSDQIIRAWQAHREEKKWFFCTAGSFLVSLIELDNFETPSKELDVLKYRLEADKPKVLAIPGGYANGFKALESNSRLMVFSNFSLTQSEEDDHRYSFDYWSVDWNIENLETTA